MRTKYLHTYLVVYETGSIAEAARRLDLTPAAVAQQVRRLERVFDAQLLQRVGRTVQPTQAGLRLVERAGGLLSSFQSLKAWVGDAEGVNELRIGAINTALHSLMPEALINFSQEHPNVRVCVRGGLTRELYEQVRNDELDAAICLSLPFALTKTISWELLREEPLVLLAPASYKTQDPLELLRTAPFIRYDRSLGGGQKVESYLQQEAISPKERFEISSLSSIAIMVERGVGVSLVPDIASLLSGRKGIVKMAMPNMTEHRKFGVLWALKSPRAHLARSFAQHARAAALGG